MALIDLLNKQQEISNGLPNTTLGAVNAGIDANTASIDALEAAAYSGVIADPGDAGAIPVTASGNVAITTAGAETRTIADPAAVGVTIDITCDVYVGDAVIASASAINVAGNNRITLGAAGHFARLVSEQVGSAFVWRVTESDGATLSTV